MVRLKVESCAAGALSWYPNVSNEGLRALSSLTALRTLDLRFCPNVSAAAKQALRTAIPNLTIHG